LIFINYRKNKSGVLEIGFDRGNAILICLVSNPNIRVHVIDNCCHSKVESCIEYINKQFNNRVILHKGDTKDVLPTLADICKTVNIYHINGWYSTDIRSDMRECYKLAKH